MTDHTGPGHGEATLSLTQERPDGSRVHQSWTVCQCTAEGLRAQLGEPAHQSVASREATEAIGRTVLDQPGSVQMATGPDEWVCEDCGLGWTYPTPPDDDSECDTCGGSLCPN